MDDLLAAAGAENVEYPLKTACCGGAHTLSDCDTSTKLVLNLLTTAEVCGADVIATECPDVSHRAGDASGPRREGARPKDLGENPLLHSASRHGARASRRARSACMRIFPILLRCCAPGDWADDRRARSNASTILPRVLTPSLLSPDAALVAAAPDIANELLALGETILESWLSARGVTPTTRTVEGFRLLALHRQGARGDASFNACRETCRELVYHRNLVCLEPDTPGHCAPAAARRHGREDIWRCSSAASLKLPGWVNFVARRGRCVSVTKIAGPPRSPNNFQEN